MDVIKKKLLLYQLNSDAAIERAEKAEQLLKEHKFRADKAESEAAALAKRIDLLEEDLGESESRLAVTSRKLQETSQAADDSERQRIILEKKVLTDDVKMDSLMSSLREAKLLAEDSDKKYEEIARKLVLVEGDLDRAEVRARSAEAKQAELEEELKLIGNNLRMLELYEEKALQRQQVQDLALKAAKERATEAESRAIIAEKTVLKLQKEVDILEGLLMSEREKYKVISDELDQTFSELTAR